MKLVFGCGYLGSRVAAAWRDAGHADSHVRRRNDRAEQFGADGFQPVVADVTDPATLANLPQADTVLFAVGFDRTVGQTIDEVYVDGVKHVLIALPDSVLRFIYISTTGVYGPADGNWVDEKTPTNPQRAGGRASLAAENVIRDHPLGDRAAILRLAGIYGPGRIPFLDDLRAGKPIAAPQDGYLNLIHVDDAVQCVVGAEQAPGAVYCVSDGHPVVRAEFYREVARLIGAREPSFVTPPPDSPRAARAASV